MGTLKDGIDIATYIGIPKKAIAMAVIAIVLLGSTAYATYWATCAYKEHSANLDDLHEVLLLQKQISREMINLKKQINNDMLLLKNDINTRLTANEAAINNLSLVTERTSSDQLDILGELVQHDATLRRVFLEKQKHIEEIQKDYLPHLNGFKIGVRPIQP